MDACVEDTKGYSTGSISQHLTRSLNFKQEMSLQVERGLIARQANLGRLKGQAWITAATASR
jgi:hypothetical protein